MSFDKRELLASCRLLYGQNVAVDLLFLQTVKPVELKKAFKKRAFATHPDRVARCGVHKQRYFADLFIEFNNAYEKLSRYVTLRDKPDNKRASVWKTTARYAGNRHYWKRKEDSDQRRSLPRRPLRFGEFLYFTERVSMRSLIEAVTAQRMERERIGEIACRWGWLSDELLRELLQERRPGERLGKVMVRNRAVTPFKLALLLRFQQICQNPLGSHFIKKNLMTEPEMDYQLKNFRLHNSKYNPRFRSTI